MGMEQVGMSSSIYINTVSSCVEPEMLHNGNDIFAFAVSRRKDCPTSRTNQDNLLRNPE